MCENQGGEDAESALREHDSQKMRPPNRKKFEDEMEEVQLQIKDQEAQMEAVRLGISVSQQLKAIKEEKMKAIAARAQISADLEKTNKTIPEKMKELTRLESCLYYRTEGRINDTIHRLEGSLLVQRFKLSEEKKIVTEIDKLKRSKRTLVQYQGVRMDIAALRDKQRKMREERDLLFREVARMKNQENKLRASSSQAKSSFTSIKQKVDMLYEHRRHLVSEYRRDKDSFLGVRDQRKRDSWKKREEERRNYHIQRDQAALDAEPLAYEAEIHICSTLLNHLTRLTAGSQETSVESLSPASSQDDPEPAEELDGQFVLLRRSEDVEAPRSEAGRKLSRRNRRSRKQSMIRKIVHTPEILADFIFLGLEAPCTIQEVLEVIEKVKAKKTHFEHGQQLLSEQYSDTGVSQPSEVSSDAGVSATESLMCELSRQASKTESCDDTRPAESVMIDLLLGCHDDQPIRNSRDQVGCYDEQGAVGGESHGSETSDTLSPQSDDVERSRGEAGVEQSEVKQEEEEVGCQKRPLTAAPSLLLTHSSFDDASSDTLVSSWPSASFSRQRENRGVEQGGGAHLAGDTITAVARRNSWRLRHQKQMSESLLSCDAKRPTTLWTAMPVTPISIESSLDFPRLTPSDDPNPQKRWSGQWSNGHQTLAQRLSSPDAETGRRRSLSKTLSSPTVTVSEREPRHRNLGYSVSQRLSPSAGSATQSLDITKSGRAASRRLTLTSKHAASGDSSPLSLDSKDFPPLPQSSPRGGSLRSSVSSQDPPPTDSYHSPREVTPSLPTSHRDKLSTERWVESSVTFTHDLEPGQPVESTRL